MNEIHARIAVLLELGRPHTQSCHLNSANSLLRNKAIQKINPESSGFILSYSER